MVAAQRIAPRQEGLALVAVLGVLAVAGLMIAHLAMLGEVVQRESAVAAERMRLKYAAESAVGDALWSYVVDRRLFANRALGQIDVARESSDWEPWMLDGRRHVGGEATLVTVALFDATGGIDLSGESPGSELRDRLDPNETEQNERIRAFLDLAADYADRNDLRREPYGKERDDYEREGILNFPRNRPLQFREEVYWLEGWREALSGHVQIIPPRNLQAGGGGARPGGPRRGAGKPPFFSSSPALVQRVLRLTDGELEIVLEARRAWRESRTPLTDSLDADLMGRINSSFSFAESGLATIEARAESRMGGIHRQVRLTLNGDLRQNAAFADQGAQALAIWERRIQ